MKRWVGLACVALISTAALSQSVCYRWFTTTSGTGVTGQYFGSPSELQAAVVAYKNANPQTGGSGLTQYVMSYSVGGTCAATPPSGTSGSRTCEYLQTRNAAGSAQCSPEGQVGCTTTTQSFTAQYNVDPEGCPACEYDGQKNWGVSPSGPYPAGGYCEGSCKVTPSQQSCSGPAGLQTCTAVLSYAEESSCSGGSKPSGSTEETPADELEGERCMDVGDGEYCVSANGGGQCGYMNDTYICLNKVKQNECKVLGDGGRVCGAGAATTPPVPDSGTPGDLAEPDGQLSDVPGGTSGTTTNYNYYNPTTVAGSSRDPGDDGAAPDGGSPSSGGGEDGEESPDCEGTTCGEGVPELEDIGTMTDAFTNFWADLQGVPIVAAAEGIAPSFGVGACPAWSETVDVYGESVEADFSFICDTWTDVSPVLTVVALVFWGVVALRILLSA